MAKVQLQRTCLRAPRAGQVLETHVEVGELTGPDAPEPAVVIADTSRLRVRAYVDEIDAPRLRVGMAAQVTADGLRDRQFAGRVVELAPQMQRKPLRTDYPTERQDTKAREVWLELEDAAELLVGLRVDVTIELGEE